MTQTKKIIELLHEARKNISDALCEDCINNNTSVFTLEEFQKICDADDVIREIMFKLLDKAGE